VVAAPEQERLESWIMQEVEEGAALPGLYPPNAENRARFEATERSRVAAPTQSAPKRS
jgi:hypothetical protein